MIAPRLKQKSTCALNPRLSVSNVFAHIGHSSNPVFVASPSARSGGGSWTQGSAVRAREEAASDGCAIWLVLCGLTWILDPDEVEATAWDIRPEEVRAGAETGGRGLG